MGNLSSSRSNKDRVVVSGVFRGPKGRLVCLDAGMWWGVRKVTLLLCGGHCHGYTPRLPCCFLRIGEARGSRGSQPVLTGRHVCS